LTPPSCSPIGWFFLLYPGLFFFPLAPLCPFFSSLDQAFPSLTKPRHVISSPYPPTTACFVHFTHCSSPLFSPRHELDSFFPLSIFFGGLLFSGVRAAPVQCPLLFPLPHGLMELDKPMGPKFAPPDFQFLNSRFFHLPAYPHRPPPKVFFLLPRQPGRFPLFWSLYVYAPPTCPPKERILSPNSKVTCSSPVFCFSRPFSPLDPSRSPFANG